MPCEARVSHVPRDGTGPRIGTRQPQVFWEYKDDDFVGGLLSLPRVGVGLAPVPPRLTVSSCGTGSWHLGDESDCAKDLLLLFVVPWEASHNYL